MDFRKAFVRGREKITVRGAAKPFALDSTTLKVESVRVNGKQASFRTDERRRKLLVKGVPKSKSVVEVDFTKQVSDDVIFGLYKSRYGKDYILATDLEPAEARTVFPCVDEPAYKAVFRVQITTDAGLKVIFNTPAVKVEDIGGGKTRHVFEETPRMSTYLLFFAIGDMEETRAMSGGVEVITATRPGQSGNSALALEMAAGSLRDFAEYYGVPYPLKKLHVVALPEYHTGAMENWGAISSRESLALVTESSAFGQKNRGASAMVHEVAHQWFGDLVTMKWWDDLWLNESFATFLGYKMTAMLRPDWDMPGIFLRDETFEALNLDAVRSTHPVQARVAKVEDAMHNFDAISYNKGASILHMLESYVGEDNFRKGVSDYLKKFSFSNASGHDLWRSLGAASRLPVDRVAREWLTRPGFPVVRVASKGNRVTLTQRRFLVTGSVPARPWPIPTTVLSGGKAKHVFLDKKSARVDVEDGSDLLLNAGRGAFHLTMYDQRGYDTLAKKFARLDPHDRAGIMNDLFLLIQAGEADPDLYLRFVGLCGGTPDSMTVETAASQLRILASIAWDSARLQEVYPAFFPPLLQKIGEDPRPGEPAYVGATREALASLYVRLDDAYAARLAPRFESYFDVNPDLRGAVATAYARTNGRRAHPRLVEMVRTLQGEVDRAKVWGALCSFKEPELVAETLALGISGEVSRSDSAYPILYAALNTGAREAYWGWLTTNYDKIRDLYAGSQQFYLYMGLVLPICGVTREADVRRFLSGRRMKQGGSSLTRALEHLAINTRLRSRLLSK
ncbi:MAG: M1 family metallopeptidase [Nitrososphaerota archaeon]|nr:M1 family metallopeptidase [Nitrososphaerota archaeon]